uniref:S1 motif domain-containing protein n=1 Tax=Zooxanthella nutricula TaxID=1333877 RepID=A0A7S2N301_9DINO
MPLLPASFRARTPVRASQATFRSAALLLGTMALLRGSLRRALPAERRGPGDCRASSSAPAFAAVAPLRPAAAASGRLSAARVGARRAAGESPAMQMFEAANAMAESEEMEELRIEDLEVGQELTGLITGVAPFGAFVDIGANVDAIIHVSQICNGYVEKIEDYLTPGQLVQVWVSAIPDPDQEGRKSRLELTMLREKTTRSLEVDLSGFEGVGPDEWLPATVSEPVAFGLWVSLAPPGGGAKARGLVHVSQIRDGFVDHPALEFRVGQDVKVRVVGIEGSKVDLSMKEYRPERQRQDVSGFIGTEGQWIIGRVSELKAFGALVKVEPPRGGDEIEGLIHISEMRADERIEKVSDVVQVGQDVKVRVLNVDVDGMRLSLSLVPEGAP